MIESRHNDQFKRWLSLTSSRGLKKHNEFLLAGEKQVAEWLQRRPDLFKNVLYTRKHDWTALLPKFNSQQVRPVELTPALFSELDVIGTHFPILVGMLPQIEKEDELTGPKGLEVVLTMSDPNNLGAAIRNAVAFGCQKIILTEEACHPYHVRALRAAAGMTLQAVLCFGPALSSITPGGPSYVLDKDGTSLYDFDFPRDFRLIIGEEGKGVPAALKGHNTLTIPTHPDCESLNAMAAASIALFSYRREHPF